MAKDILNDEVNFDFDLLAEIAEQAPTAGGGNYTNYGRTWMDNLQVSTWDNDERKFVKVPYVGGQIAQGSTLEFQLHQEIEKRDGDSFTKTWYIQVKESGKKASSKTDWGEYIKPSAIKVFKSLGAFFKAMSGKGSYAAVEDYVTGRTRKAKDGSDKEYDITVPVFQNVFKNKIECYKAKDARFAKDALPVGAVPVGIINTFKATVESLGGLQETMDQFPDEFEGYPVDDVVRESGLK